MPVYLIKSLNCPKCRLPFNSDVNRMPVYRLCGYFSCLSCVPNGSHACNLTYANQPCTLEVEIRIDALTKLSHLHLSADKKTYETDSPCDIVIPANDFNAGSHQARILNDFTNELNKHRVQHFTDETAGMKRTFLEQAVELQRYQLAGIICSGCKSKYSVEELLNCIDCSTTNCKSCTSKEHDGHDTTSALPQDMAELVFAKTTKRFDALVAGNERNYRVLNAQIGEKIKEFQAASQGALELMKTNPEQATQIAHQVTEAAEDFERICEKTYPPNRIMNDQVDELIAKIAGITATMK